MSLEELVDEIINEIHRKYPSEMAAKKKMTVLGDLNAHEEEQLSSCYDVYPLSDHKNEADGILIPKLSNRLLSELAVGLCSSKEAEIIMKTLMEGRLVYALSDGFEYKRYQKTCNPNLYALFMDYEKKLYQYGVTVISGLHELCIPQWETHVQAKDFTEKRLLSETDLQSINQSEWKLIRISKKCIITPLAMDYIRDHGFRVERI